MIPFVRDFEFEYGRCDQVSPLIRRVVARNPGPFTFTGTGTYIVGQGAVAVIDPGPADPEHLEALNARSAGDVDPGRGRIVAADRLGRAAGQQEMRRHETQQRGRQPLEPI